jgi:hypothetical protein
VLPRGFCEPAQSDVAISLALSSPCRAFPLHFSCFQFAKLMAKGLTVCSKWNGPSPLSADFSQLCHCHLRIHHFPVSQDNKLEVIQFFMRPLEMCIKISWGI